MDIRLLFVGGLLFAGCEHAELIGPSVDPSESDSPTLTQVQEDVFNQSCALSGCHAGGTAAAGLNLSAGQAHANIVGIPSLMSPDRVRVHAGNPDESFLLIKVEGSLGMVGSRMPLGREPLSAEKIALLRGWIEDGALDN